MKYIRQWTFKDDKQKGNSNNKWKLNGLQYIYNLC